MILLDTHVWYWYLSDAERLSPDAKAFIERSRLEAGLRISIISCWEILQKAATGKLKLADHPAKWLGYALSDPKLTVADLTPQIVADAVLLPGKFHKDPADRFIVATARTLRCPLMTEDKQILAYSHVQFAGF